VNAGITREQALALVRERIANANLVKHCLATEAVMRALAHKFGEDEEEWGLAGLLHDLDVEMTNADLKVHGLETEKLLRARGVSEAIVDAIKRHNPESCGLPRETRFHHALAAGETITGLIVATTLVYPDKKLASVKPSSVVKRMKEKAFAAAVNRDTIRECELIGMPLAEFAAFAVEAMKPISAELGL